jgi:hypothetical protein
VARAFDHANEINPIPAMGLQREKRIVQLLAEWLM